MSFDEAAVNTLIDNVVSHAQKLGIFRTVNSHEPKSPPRPGTSYAVWADQIEAVGPASGLAASSGYVVFIGRIYGNMLQKPEDDIDPRIVTAATTLLNAYTGDFDFGATVRAIDLFGMYGQKMGAKAGYLPLSDGMYRVMDITIPVIFNDMWTITA